MNIAEKPEVKKALAKVRSAEDQVAEAKKGLDYYGPNCANGKYQKAYNNAQARKNRAYKALRKAMYG